MASELTDEHGLPLWPAAERNKQPIAELLREVLPDTGTLLEIASGTGQHALHFTQALPQWTIQPSDRDPEHLETLRRRVAAASEPRLLPPIELDVTAEPPPLEVTAIYCANMVHIAPWAACVGLFSVAERLLRSGDPLVTYGPYSVGGKHTAESNARFDASLRERSADFGVRDLDAMDELGRQKGLRRVQTHPMPANNFLVVWRHT